MEITVKGEAKEIAALVVALQERQGLDSAENHQAPIDTIMEGIRTAIDDMQQETLC